jgi:lantibiotic biosynthesis protein
MQAKINKRNSRMMAEHATEWRPVLDPEQAATAVSMARTVVARLREPEGVEAAVAAAAQQTSFPKSVHWLPYGVAQGDAGLAVMCGYLDQCFPDEDWDVVGHQYLSRAGRGAEALPYRPAGLWAGLSGLAFATWYLSRDGVRYRRLLAAVEEILVPDVIRLAGQVAQQKQGIPVSQFDVISGLSGIGAYLLCRQADAPAAAALAAVVRALVELCGEVDGLPRWHTPASAIGDESMLRAHPHGNLNCGLAHGIPGPLALLALARLGGIEVEGLAEAIDELARWLSANRCDDPWGVNWPTTVALEAVDTPGGPTLKPGLAVAAPYGPSRTAWCYGSPGVARALWLAGEALDRSEYRDLALAGMEAIARRPLANRWIDSPTFCHGVAGLMQITLRFAHDTGQPGFAEAARALGDQLLALFDPATRLGYYNLEPGGVRVDQPGLLDGVPGTALVLLAAATGVTPTWDRLFLLA